QSGGQAPRLPMCFTLLRPPLSPTLLPYTTLFRSHRRPGPQTKTRTFGGRVSASRHPEPRPGPHEQTPTRGSGWREADTRPPKVRSEEHTSELQSQSNLVCRLLPELKKIRHVRGGG